MPDCEYFEELCSLSLDGVLTRAKSANWMHTLRSAPPAQRIWKI